MNDSIKDHIKSRIARITMSKVTDEEVDAVLAVLWPGTIFLKTEEQWLDVHRALEQFASSRAVPVNDDELVQRLKNPLPVCPFDSRSPEYWTAGENGAPCPVCGMVEDGPDLCRNADTRIMDEAASRISDQAADLEYMAVLTERMLAAERTVQDQAAEIERLTKERDEARARTNEVVAEEFEGDCWKAMKRLLNECNFDWRGIDEIAADDAEEYIKVELDELKISAKRLRTRAEAAERELETLSSSHKDIAKRLAKAGEDLAESRKERDKLAQAALSELARAEEYKAHLADALKALEIYADPENWVRNTQQGDYISTGYRSGGVRVEGWPRLPDAIVDQGKCARSTIARIKGDTA